MHLHLSVLPFIASLPFVCLCFTTSGIWLESLASQLQDCRCLKNTPKSFETKLLKWDFILKPKFGKPIMMLLMLRLVTKNVLIWHVSSSDLWLLLDTIAEKTNFNLGSGCGSVGRPVSSDTRGLRFESSHWQNFILRAFIYCQLY